MQTTVRRSLTIVWVLCCASLTERSPAGTVVASATQSQIALSSLSGTSQIQPIGDRNRRRLLDDLAATWSGREIAHYLEVLACEPQPGALDGVSAPRPAALAEYFNRFVPAGIDRPASDLTAQSWTAQMRGIVRRALSEPVGETLTDEQFHHLVGILPLFLSPTEAAALDANGPLERALLAEARAADSGRFDDRVLRRGTRFWVRSAWREDSDGVRGLRLRGLLNTAQRLDPKRAAAFVNRWDRMLGLSPWLAARPERLESLLADGDRNIRQRALVLALDLPGAEALIVHSAAMQSALIEALAGDNLPGNATLAARRLAAAGSAVGPALHYGYRTSQDPQQKSALARLLGNGEGAPADEDSEPATDDSITAGRNLVATIRM
jgi:hypothetical protein